jgi:signal transduction histidine kinase
MAPVQPVEASPEESRAAVTALRAVMWVGAGLPLVLFVIIGWALYTQRLEAARLRVDSAARVGEEHALKVLETNAALLNRVGDLLGDASTDALRAREREIHLHLVRMADGLPQLQGIFVIGRDAHLVATNRLYPAPKDIDYSDRPAVRHHRGGGAQPFFSILQRSRATGEQFFDVSIRRAAVDGDFGGVLSTSLAPEYFQDFYSKVAGEDRSLNIVLLREDGAVLARWPQPAVTREPPPTSAPASAPPPEPLVPAADLAMRDDRIGAHRVLARQPVHVVAWMEHSDMLAPWLRQLVLLAGLVLPAMVALLYVTSIALQRTRRSMQAVRALHEQTEHRQRVEEALRQAQKLEALGRLSGGVAHDFNNLLMVMGNNVYLQRRLAPALAESPQLAAIERAIAAGTKLTRQLLSFSRRQALRPEQVTLQERMPVVLDMIKPALGAAIGVHARVAPQTRPIEVDIAEFELALLNLAINARDAMPDGGELHVDVGNTQDGEWGGRGVVVAVRDTGVGIAAADLPRVFEPFFTTKGAAHGTGLGLSQVHGFCERAGGTARIDSTPGNGTTVRMIFPAVAAALANPVPADRDDTALLQGVRVLLVEDNEEVAAGTAAVLRSMGCVVHREHDASRAMRQLEQRGRDFDIMLSDIVMPGATNGIELAMWARAAAPHLPTLLMSGYSDSMERAHALQLDVLPKPCEPAAMGAAIRAALRARSTAVPPAGVQAG